MMMRIDRWVSQAAFMGYSRQVTEGKAAFIKNWIIKLSSESLADEGFLEYVKGQFVYHQIPPEVVCFEITETAAIVNLSKTTQFMRELKSLGCRFCLAGFGNSMSSFAYLKHLPIDLLKIDGAFVKDLAHDPIDRAMVEAINNIAHVMSFETIAEHVEDNTLLQILRHMGG